MINLLFNREEKRFRAGIRIPFFFLGMIGFVALIQLIPMAGLQWVFVIPFAYGWYRLNLLLTDHRTTKDSPWYHGGLYWNKTSLIYYIIGWAIGLLALSSMVGVGWMLGYYNVESVGYVVKNNATYNSAQLFRLFISWYYSIFLFFVQMLAVGFYEEVMIRGYMLINLREGVWWKAISEEMALFVAVILSSLVFSLAHLFNPNVSIITFLTIVLAGLLLAFPFVCTGNLALSVGLHNAWNFILGGIFGFKVSGLSSAASIVSIQSTGPEWWTGGLFGPEAGISGVFAMSLSLLLIIIFLQKSFKQSGIHNHWLNPTKGITNHLYYKEHDLE
tara:strand:- start:58 stop:1050 length:993 start_codon:yes stop_codon:yes gene_type:complete